MGLSPGTLRAEAGPGLSRPVQPSTPCEAALPAQGRGPGVSGDREVSEGAGEEMTR